MFKRLMYRWVLMNEAGGSDGGSGTAGAAGAGAGVSAGNGQSGAGSQAGGAGAGEGAAAGSSDLTPPTSLLGDGKAEEGGSEKKPDEAAGEKKPEGEAKPDEPVKYEPFKLPDGLKVDEAKLGDFTKIAAEARIPQDVAQKMVDLYTSELKQLTEAPMRAWTELQNSWRNEVINDPEIGGAKLDQNLAMIKTGLKNLLGEQSGKFFEALNVTGAGNNPDIVRGLFKAAQPHAPATPVSGNPGKGSSKTPGATLYPQMAGLGNGHEG